MHLYLEKLYFDTLVRIANYDENFEDYYGGVSIDYFKIVNDIMSMARKAINKAVNTNKNQRVRCEIQNGCCEPHLETAYKYDFNHLKKAIETGDKDE